MRAQVRSGAGKSGAGKSLWCAIALALLCPAASAGAADYPVTWTAFPIGLLEIETGDTVTFTVPGSHDLREMAGQTEYDTCDFTGATLAIAPGNVSTLTFDTPGTYLYACSLGGGFHCDADAGLAMKISIVVSDATLPMGVPGLLAMAIGLSGVGAASWSAPRPRGRKRRG